ncbi:MAG: type II toxin-antitoxin system HicB family antitoxin [Gammaproteobacteria bacterium]|nr:type II toxin-antitoxin system HicB family antitoxin [Gammaproteobacteria bacterium]
MRGEYTAVVKQVPEGWIEALPGGDCQEPTPTALLESLRIILIDALEFNKREASL